MCFSATARFAAGAALLIVGTVTVRRARRRIELILDLFGVQQRIESASLRGLAERHCAAAVSSVAGNTLRTITTAPFGR